MAIVGPCFAQCQPAIVSAQQQWIAWGLVCFFSDFLKMAISEYGGVFPGATSGGPGDRSRRVEHASWIV